MFFLISKFVIPHSSTVEERGSVPTISQLLQVQTLKSPISIDESKYKYGSIAIPAESTTDSLVVT